MVTIDLQADDSGYARPVSIFNKANLMSRFNCSESTLKRMIRVLDDSVPDEFSKQSNQRVYTADQVKMLDWVAQQLAAKFTYQQIEVFLSEGFPDEY